MQFMYRVSKKSKIVTLILKKHFLGHLVHMFICLQICIVTQRYVSACKSEISFRGRCWSNCLWLQLMSFGIRGRELSHLFGLQLVSCSRYSFLIGWITVAIHLYGLMLSHMCYMLQFAKFNIVLLEAIVMSFAVWPKT